MMVASRVMPAFATKVALNNSEGGVLGLGMIRVEEQKTLVLPNGSEVLLLGKKMMGELQHLLWGKFHGRYRRLGLGRKS